MATSDARILPTSIPNAFVREREHCSAHRNQTTAIGRNKGQQVRIGRHVLNGTQLGLALYTTIPVRDEEADVVLVRYRDPESTHHDLRDRLGVSSTDPFTGKVNSRVPDDEEKCNSEFVERVTDSRRLRGLIAIALHGGNIEPHTDEQAERVGKLLACKCVSVWLCKGFKTGGGAFDRWHITSTDISEESFPKLKAVIGRHFEYAVAFHGWGEDSICIGGSAPPPLKREIKTAVERAISGSGIVVATSEEGRCPGAFTADNPKNIVNRLGAIGIQLEQSREARARYGIQIADAVADVLKPRIIERGARATAFATSDRRAKITFTPPVER